MIIDKGFYVDNYVGTYRMVYDEELNATMIVSNERNCAAEGEKSLKKKRIFCFDSSDEYIFLKLANLDISDDEEILKYCNSYGLPYSSQLCMDNELHIDEDIEYVARDFIRASARSKYSAFDTMDREEFRRIATTIRMLVEFKNVLNEAHTSSRSSIAKELIYYLVYFSLFSHEEIYEYDNTDPIPQTRTVFFQYSFQHFCREIESQESGLSIEEKLYVYLQYTKELSEKWHNGTLQGKRIPYLKINMPSYTLQTIMSFYQLLFARKLLGTNGWLTKIKDGINEVPEAALSLLPLGALKEACVRVFSDIVNEGLVCVNPWLIADDSKQLTVEGHWRLKHQMEGIYMELFIEIAKNSQYRRCDNPTCAKLFSVSRNRPNKRYCCHECAALQAKRNERKRKRAQHAEEGNSSTN